MIQVLHSDHQSCSPWMNDKNTPWCEFLSEQDLQFNETKALHCCCVAATLTSYSENMERGGKYGEGSRGNLKQWHSQKSGMDSFLYRVDENMTASTYSLNKIPERNLESMSSHSAHSIPLYLMPRPNSVAGESLRPSCPSFLLSQFKLTQRFHFPGKCGLMTDSRPHFWFLNVFSFLDSYCSSIQTSNAFEPVFGSV